MKLSGQLCRLWRSSPLFKQRMSKNRLIFLVKGEQDQLLQAHSALWCDHGFPGPLLVFVDRCTEVGMRYVRSWLVISKRNGKFLQLVG